MGGLVGWLVIEFVCKCGAIAAWLKEFEGRPSQAARSEGKEHFSASPRAKHTKKWRDASDQRSEML